VALRTGTPGKLPSPQENYRQSLPAPVQAMLDHIGQASAIGTADDAAAAIQAFEERTGADEIIFGGSTFDPACRAHSVELAMERLTR
jgi:alkanesulfonate monooxygenase SsuD/methylene tetrahydromethanopterin reductase-like flavin-dependent oxidoreductase (luciferase family)